ncbi:hypothetical protein E2C01_044968 [Portunus trituberculatus]|uniref:Uncharacterized protein n=1 Tax=Portunus trituberculatus TaxID=210409 RepID=A0A5B7G1V9_PORTR|nr:hypothetical protein [Portunus trituberculatus]
MENLYLSNHLHLPRLHFSTATSYPPLYKHSHPLQLPAFRSSSFYLPIPHKHHEKAKQIDRRNMKARKCPDDATDGGKTHLKLSEAT